MGLLDKFKKKVKVGKEDKKIAPVKKEETKPALKEKGDYSSLKPKGEADSKPVSGIKEKVEKTTKKSKTDTKDAYKVLIRPLITEKATYLATYNKYCFEVSTRSNKIEIKRAIKSLYGVDPIDVNIVNMRGKRVRYGRISGKKKNWKKAVISLKKGDKIELYEGV